MIKSKRLLAAGLVAVLGLTAAACGGDDDDTTDTPSEDTADAASEDTATEDSGDMSEDTGDMSEDTGDMSEDSGDMSEDSGDDAAATELSKVCEVTDVGGVDDRGFNQISFEGAQSAADELGIEAEVLESATDADYPVNIQSFIEAGCDLIITVGFLLGDATATAAADNPDQEFAIIDFGYEEPIENVATLNFDVAPPSFLAGYLAAGMTETGTVATYGGINIPTVTVFMDGFVKGVNYYNAQKGTDVAALGWDIDAADGTFAGNFENLDDGKALAASFAQEGADIVFPVAGPVGLGSAAYAQEEGGMRIIGVDSDGFLANPNQGEVYLTSVLKKIDVAVNDTIIAMAETGDPGDSYLGTLENDGVGLAPYHDQDGDVSDELKAEIEDLKAQLISGEVEVG